MAKKLRAVILTVFGLALMSWLILVRPADSSCGPGAVALVRGDEPTGEATGTTTPPVTVSPTEEAVTTTPVPTMEGVSTAYVMYSTEEIEIAATKPVYYAILKKDTDKGVKASELIPAAANDYGGYYYVDISTVSASKEAYIGITTTLTPGSDGLVPVLNIPVHANDKKIVFNVNWAAEGIDANGYGILQSVVITNNSSQTISYEHTTTVTTTVKNIKSLDIQWRKGANGDWHDISQLTRVRWESMKNSGAVVYFRLDAKDQGKEVEGRRFSKENKIKCNITKATSVKLDVSKLTITLKNGMQFRPTGTNNWYTLLPYSSASKTETLIRTVKGTAFDPFTENTLVKASFIPIDDLYTTLAVSGPSVGSSMVFDVRIAATAKKSASRISTVSIPGQADAPEASVWNGTDGCKISGLKPNAADKLVESPAFEYFIAKRADAQGNFIDMTTVKWATVKEGTLLKSNCKGVYTSTKNGRVEAKITDSDAVILIRRRGVAASSKNEAVLASKYLILTIPPVASGTPSPTPSPVPTEEPTTTPTP